MSKRSRRDEDFGFKSSTGVNYKQVSDRQVENKRYERPKAVRGGSASTSASVDRSTPPKPSAPSATMDAVMRMLTGKEERTIADRISDPNRPTWEQYKKENADKLDLSNKGEKEMREYRKKLDAQREKALSRNKKKSKRRKYSSASSSDESDDNSSDIDRRESSRKKSKRKRKKNRKRSRSSSGSEDEDDDATGSSDDERREKKYKSSKKKKKKSKKRKKTDSNESSPVRLSSFFQQRGSDSESE